MAKKSIHHIEFPILVEVNREVTALTGEPCEYSTADEQKLRNLITEVEQRADNEEYDEAVAEKAALLVFKIASGQYFRAGNKRTALVSGLVFLAKNGHKLDISNQQFVDAVEKAGIGAATLDDVYEHLRSNLKKTTSERKGWEKAVSQTIEERKDYLTKIGS